MPGWRAAAGFRSSSRARPKDRAFLLRLASERTTQGRGSFTVQDEAAGGSRRAANGVKLDPPVLGDSSSLATQGEDGMPVSCHSEAHGYKPRRSRRTQVLGCPLRHCLPWHGGLEIEDWQCISRTTVQWADVTPWSTQSNMADLKIMLFRKIRRKRNEIGSPKPFLESSFLRPQYTYLQGSVWSYRHTTNTSEQGTAGEEGEEGKSNHKKQTRDKGGGSCCFP